ncbi:FMN-binding protein [uncultured Demequina sp.]|uniref:FMN-binding protein n=1 Tax=uncultured Demequina sp. TaxID=693499 RepID=UPI0025FE81F3|nr:FMN-binding protein [uncultured Demequina sp.]
MKTSRALIVGGASAAIIAGAVIAAPSPLSSESDALADDGTAEDVDTGTATTSDDDCERDIDPDSNSGRGNTEDPVEERERDDDPSGDDCVVSDVAEETGNDSGTGAVAGAEVVDGPVVSNIRGDYQVRLHIEGGVVVDVEFPVAGTSASESRRINEMALPVLEERFLEAQSADVEVVSGASYTSPAMIESAAAAFADAGL